MGKNLTREQRYARADAYEYCIVHLETVWTDDPLRFLQGKQVVRLLKAKMDKLRKAKG